MGAYTSDLIGLLNKDVIVYTTLSNQLHGKIVKLSEQLIELQMVDQKKYINSQHVVSVVSKDSITI